MSHIPAPAKRLLARLSFLAAVGIMVWAFFYVAEVATSVRLPHGEERMEFYSTEMRDDLRRTLVAAIEGAESSIVAAIYNLSDASVTQALRAKAEDGVDVTVIVDRKASSKAQRFLGPKVKTIRRAPDGLMHLKILILDQAQVWIGTANMSFESLRVHGNMIAAFDNPELASELQDALLQLGDIGPAPYFTPLQFTQGSQQGTLWLLPTNKQGLQALIDVIDSAQESLHVAMFTWTHPKITDAVIRAHDRGVDTHVVLDRHQGRGVSAEAAKLLHDAGVAVALSQGDGLLHHKTAIVDGNVLVTGSANWTRSAFKRNDDCFLVVEDLDDEQQAWLEKMWRIITLDSAPL